MTRQAGKMVQNRRKRSGVMLAEPLDVAVLKKWPYAYAQPKIDGMRCVAYVRQGNCTLYTSSGKEIETVPHINAQLTDKMPRDIILDGELTVRDGVFNDVVSIIKRGGKHTDSELVQYNLFDVVDYAMPQKLRLIELFNLSTSEHVSIVSTSIIEDVSKVGIVEDRYINMGYEGVILRNPLALYIDNRTKNMMKHKPTKSDVYEIVGVNQEIDIYGAPKYSVGSFTCISNERKMFTVGSGLTKEQREEYWDMRSILVGMYVLVRYQELTPRGVPRFPVFLKVINGIELKQEVM